MMRIGGHLCAGHIVCYGDGGDLIFFFLILQISSLISFAVPVVEPRGGFIVEHDLGPEDKRSGETDPFALAAGEFGGQLVDRSRPNRHRRAFP